MKAWQKDILLPIFCALCLAFVATLLGVKYGAYPVGVVLAAGIVGFLLVSMLYCLKHNESLLAAILAASLISIVYNPTLMLVLIAIAMLFLCEKVVKSAEMVSIAKLLLIAAVLVFVVALLGGIGSKFVLFSIVLEVLAAILLF